MALKRCTFIDNTDLLSHPVLWTISTLLNVSVWKVLHNHPDQSLAHYNTDFLGHPALWITGTFLNASVWEEALHNHLDQLLAFYIIKGLSEGSRIGFDHSHFLVTSKRSLPSATRQSEVLANYFEKEVLFGKVLVLFFTARIGISIVSVLV